MYKILLIENQSIAVLGLTHMIAENDENLQVVAATTFKEAEQILQSMDIDHVMMGPYFSSAEKLIPLILMLQDFKKTPFSFFADNIKTLSMQYLYKNGMKGIMAKNINKSAINEAIKTIRDNRIYLSDNLKEELIHDYFEGGDHFNKKLTFKENVIAHMLRAGKNNTQICELLNLKPSTVSTFKHKILSKMRAKNIFELDGYPVSRDYPVRVLS